jgi:hypothetical protein
VVVDDHFVVELRMLLKYPSQFIDYARIGILHGIEHAADHLAVGDRPAIGCAEGQAPDLEFLDERQAQEREFREKALDAVYRAPESMRERAWLGVNARLKDMGIEPLARPSGVGIDCIEADDARRAVK